MTAGNWVKSTCCEANACLEVTFTKASFSGNEACVEYHAHNDAVHVRDSKDPDGPFLTFTPQEWNAFIQGAKAGEFDL